MLTIRRYCAAAQRSMPLTKKSAQNQLEQLAETERTQDCICMQEARTCLSCCMHCKLLLLCRLATADLDWEEGVLPPKMPLQKLVLTEGYDLCSSCMQFMMTLVRSQCPELRPWFAEGSVTANQQVVFSHKAFSSFSRQL